MLYIDLLPFEPWVKDKLQKLVEIVLSSGIGCTKIVLFGSYARAEYTVTSDIDILVLTVAEVSRVTRGELCSIFDELNADLVFYTEDIFNSSQMLIVKQIRRDGVLLWQN